MINDSFWQNELDKSNREIAFVYNISSATGFLELGSDSVQNEHDENVNLK